MVLLQPMATNSFDPKNPKTWPEYTPRPTEAITNVGQEARNLARFRAAKNRFASNAITPVSTAGDQFSLAGMQTPYESFNLTPGAITKAALLAMGPGAAKQALNATYMLGKTVVHGSPESGLKEVTPRLNSARFPEDKIAYGWDPGFIKNDPRWTGNAAALYSGEKSGGSIYVGRVPRNAIYEDPNGVNPMVMSSKPIRIKSEIPATNTSSAEFEQALLKALRRNGVGIIPKRQIGDWVSQNSNKLKGMFTKMPENIA